MPVPLRNTKRAYGVVSQAFHWLIVALIIFQYTWAWRIDQAEGLRDRFELVTQHKTVGMTILILALLRLLWRLFNRPPALPAQMPRWEQNAAHAGHWILYGLILIIPLSGWAYSSAAGFGGYWWGPIDFPAIAPESEDLEDLFRKIHEWLTTALAFVAIGHALAALRHHFWLKDKRTEKDAADMAKGLKTAALALLILPGLALADCFRADQDDGWIEFTGVAEGNAFTGRFEEFEVSLCMDGRDLASAGIEVVIQTASADTGSRQRDSELLGEHFFDVEQYPQATWKSTDIGAAGDGFLAEGRLMLRGIAAAQPVRLNLTDGEPPVLSGSAEILRLDWKVGSGDPDFEDTGFIRNRVDLAFELRLQPYSEE